MEGNPWGSLQATFPWSRARKFTDGLPGSHQNALVDVGILTLVFVGYVNIYHYIYIYMEVSKVMGVPLDHPF